MGQIPNAETAVTMDFKQAGNSLYLIGETKNELGGSHFSLVRNLTGGASPTPDTDTARKTFYALHAAIAAGLVRACHDLSEGGMAAGCAEMAFAGELGAEIWAEHIPVDLDAKAIAQLAAVSGLSEKTAVDMVRLFSESNSRFLAEVPPEKSADFEKIFADANLPLYQIGKVVGGNRLMIKGAGGSTLVDAELAALKSAWQKPFDMGGEYK